ncbi:hypothetical protein [Paracoccus pacificus]|uniref:Uncharacterized protein n=1 Tax=Paracoccus pacificus TaxID=1463598 RepID=A0ABW4R8V1_9RHOB
MISIQHLTHTLSRFVLPLPESVVPAMMPNPLFAIRLINRATGEPHKVAGIPLTVFSHDPDETAADLMRNRDARNWATAVEPVAARGGAA